MSHVKPQLFQPQLFQRLRNLPFSNRPFSSSIRKGIIFMQKANSKTLAFRLLAVTSTMSMTAAFLAAAAPPVRAAQVGGVQGTIKDTTGQAVPGAQVQLIPQGGAPRFARTDASGVEHLPLPVPDPLPRKAAALAAFVLAG